MTEERPRPERARLFVALELPADVRAALVQWRSDRVHGVDGLRFVDPDGLHVTLCFLGSQPAEEIPAVARACRAFAGHAPSVLTVGEPIWLPPRRPGVLAVSIEDASSAPLAVLQSELAAALTAGGWYEPERRPFRAHVTVARVSRGAAARSRDLRSAELALPAPISFIGRELMLMRSRLGRAGARYERLATVSLSG